MAIIRKDSKEEFYPKLCTSTLFFTVLRLKNKKSGNQDECFKDFLSIIDPSSVEKMPDTTLHRYSSDCKNANPLPEDSEYIRFADKNIPKIFREEMRNHPQDVLERIKGFSDKYFPENSHKLVVQTLLDLISKDKSISEHKRSLYINPGFVPSLTDEFLKDDATIYYYNFLLGVWFYVYDYFTNAEEGRDTIEQWTTKTKAYTADKVRQDIDEVGFENIKIVYDTELVFDEQLRIEGGKNTQKIIMPNGIAPDLSSVDFEDDENGVFVVETVKQKKYNDKFSKYIYGALETYSMKKGFLDTRERKFRDFYVCGDVCQKTVRPISFTNRILDAIDGKNTRIPPIKDIKIENLRKNFCIFTGTGGAGKSMMLNKFFLDEAESYKPQMRVPIMVSLRKYEPDKNSLEVLMVSELKRFDPKLQMTDLYYLLESGRAVCLLDGFDEIDDNNLSYFQDELDILKDGYKDSYFILTSRGISAVSTLTGVLEYEMQNLDIDQACELISKLDPERVDDELKADFIEKIKRDEFHFNRDEKRNFVGNPLFISLMIRTYDMIHDIPRKRYVFYEKTYTAMASEYDSRTKRMTRPFFTGLDEKSFQRYLSEFAGILYSEWKFSFDRDLMLDCFDQVVIDNDLNIDANLFIRDVTEKLCLIYKDGDVYEFIHRSFQEYFAALYYLSMLNIDNALVLETLRELDNKMKMDDTLFMMYGIDDKNMEKFVILPFLEEMFIHNDMVEDYKEYLRKYYPVIEYVTGDLEEDMCCNDDQSSAMYYFVKKQFDIDHGYVSSSFERDESIADDTEEYFWIEERWFSNSGNGGNMRLVQRYEIPNEYFTAYQLDDADEIESDRGYLCSISVTDCLEDNPDNKIAFDIIMSKFFPIRDEFNALRKLYDTLKNKYYGINNMSNRRIGLRKV